MTFPEIDKLCSCGDFDNKYVEIFQKEKEKKAHTHVRSTDTLEMAKTSFKNENSNI